MRAAIVALADLGRSARMRYHARALASQGVDVDLVGFEGTPLPKAVAEDAMKARTDFLAGIGVPQTRGR